jgi:hypothetical protein
LIRSEPFLRKYLKQARVKIKNIESHGRIV